MFSSTRSCLRRRARDPTIPESLNSLRTELLLFLYPRFFVTAVEKPIPRARSNPSRPRRCPIESSSGITAVTNASLRHHSSLPRSIPLAAPENRPSNGFDLHTAPGSSVTTTSSSNSPSTLRSKNPFDLHNGHHMSSFSPDNGESPKHTGSRRMRKPSTIRFLPSGFIHPSLVTIHRHGHVESRKDQVINGLRQKQRMAEALFTHFGGKPGREDAIPPTEGQVKIVLELTNPDIMKLIGDERENVWYLPFLNGCRVHVLPPVRRLGHRKVVLTGSQTAVDTGRRYLMDQLHQSLETEDHQDQTNLLAPNLHTVTQNLKPPRFENVKQMADFIEKVTTPPPLSVRHALLLRDGLPYDQTVEATLARVLRDPENFQYLSSRSTNLLIMFLRNFRARDKLRVYLPTFERFITPRTARSLIMAAIRQLDIVVFKFCVQAIERAGIEELDGWLWVAMCCMVPGGKGFDSLIQAYNGGLLRSKAVFQMAVSVAITPKFAEYLNAGYDFAIFMEDMRRMFGNERQWLSIRAINMMIKEAALTDKPNVLNEILEYSAEKHVHLNTVSLNYALPYYSRSSTTREFPVRFYRQFCETFALAKPNKQTFCILWELACDAQAYNVCRVLWRYSCLTTGDLPYEMKNNVYVSLLRNMDINLLSPEEIFFQYVGKIVVGVTSPGGNLLGTHPSPTSHGVDILQHQSGSDRHTQYIAMNKLLNTDLMSWETGLVFERPLEYMLEEAYGLDLQWKRDGLDGRPIKWLIENAIKIPLIQGSSRCLPNEEDAAESKDETKPEETVAFDFPVTAVK